MTGALLRKELRELLPWAILGLAISIVDLTELFVQQVDMQPLGQTYGLLNDFDAFMYWLIAFAIGTGLVTREQDDGTLAFLDGLPVSRSRSFLVKSLVMAALVLIPPSANTAAIALMHLLSRGSLDGPLHGMLLLEAFALQALLVVNGLVLGAALGRLRSLTWLVLGIATIGLMLLGELVPRVALLNPLSLLDWQWLSTDLAVDRETLYTQLGITGAAFVIAWHGFVRAGKKRSATLAARPVLGAFITIATIAVGAGASALLLSRLAQDPTVAAETAPPSYEFVGSPPAETVTRHYRLSYPAHESAAALELADRADGIFEHVHALLGVPLGEPIDVDASGSIRNTHGTAYDGRVQMTLSSELGSDLVLAHETAHVVAQRAAGDASAWLWRSAPVLNEGLASWVELDYRKPEAQGDDRMLLLAALHVRRELDVEELANPGLLEQRRDENLKYSAGEAIITAMVDLYGEGAIPRMLAAFGDPRLPSDLRGVPLWQAAFQLAGMDLGAVLDEFFRNVSAFAEEHAERIAALPRPRVRLVRVGDRIGAAAVLDLRRGPPPGLVLRFKPEPASPIRLFRQTPVQPGVPVGVPPTHVVNGRVCVQPGVEIGDQVLFEPLTCLPVSDALVLDQP